ncbi:MAG TPA: hypothetical protein VOA41_11010 [Candidatus Dormibacteraeota bacterium]|nr:hypothetical protein [Candidatus Dormibacteraeota bacterium]
MPAPEPFSQASSQRPQFPWWALAGAAVLLLFFIFSIWQSRRARSELTELQLRLNGHKTTRLNLRKELALAKRAREIVSDPVTVRFTLQAKTAPALHACWHPKLGIFIYGGNVPIPAADHTLLLWLIPKETTSSPRVASIFRPDAAGIIALVLPFPPAPINSTAALAISEESSTASRQLTSTPIWLSTVPQ